MALIPRKLLPLHCEKEGHFGNTTCLDIGSTGGVLVTGGQDKLVNLWAFDNEEKLMSLSGHNGSIMCVKFAYHDNVVFTADEYGVIKRWGLQEKVVEDSTYYGHLKSVRTIDCHPFGDYFVSGCNDTSIRLWDIRSNQCIKKYRGHMANVNSVKFSPDGSWIASAGTEGSVIIWDIRQSKQLIEFPEHASPVTCVQFHPYELLLGAGRNDGTVDLYDLESQKIIARATDTSFSGNTVKCITFSDKGDCLFVGSTIGVSVIGWEPDRDLGHMEATWNMLGDMKIVRDELVCGAYEASKAMIYKTPIKAIFAPVTSKSAEAKFESHHPVRRSFNKGSGKLRLSLQGSSKHNKTSPSSSSSYQNHSEDGLSSPNLSIEMIEENDQENAPEFPTDITYIQLPPPNRPLQQPEITNTYSLTPKLSSGISYQHQNMVDIDDLSSNANDSGLTSYFSDDALILAAASQDIQAEKEDFPINNAQPPDYTVKPLSKVSRTTANQKPQMIPRSSNKLTNSVSTMELNKIGNDDNAPQQQSTNYSSSRRPMSRGTSPVRNIRSVKKADQNSVLNRENNKNRNISVQIMQKPLRSKSSIDMKNMGNTTPTQIPKMIPYTNGDMSYHMAAQPQSLPTSDEIYIRELQEKHTEIISHLSARNAQLQLLLKTIQGQDITTIVRKTIEMNDRGLLVDIIGAMTEQLGTWNLDMCVLLLPQLYEWLQGEYQHHAIRACDTIRHILTQFQTMIQDTCSYWGSNIGVDLSHEERVRKCNECRQWLLRIKQLPLQSKDKTLIAPISNVQKLITIQ